MKRKFTTYLLSTPPYRDSAVAVAILLFAFLLSPLFSTSSNAKAAVTDSTPDIVIDLFHSPTCSHCKDELAFLIKFKEKYPEVIVKQYSVFIPLNTQLLEEYYNKYKVPKSKQGSVPVTFIKDRYYIGFTDSIGNDIENQVKKILDKTRKQEDKKTNAEIKAEERSVLKLPFFGEIKLSNHSPLFLSIALGTLDGFNACAMVALGFLLAVLIATKMRKRVLLVGGTFILVSGLVYFLFISAWLNLFMFLGHAKWITVVVSLITIIFAIFMLKDFAVGIVCKICKIDPKGKNILNNWQRKLFTKLSIITTSKMSLPMMLLGVVLVAAGINTVELFCSFGFPLAFTNFLTTLNLSTSSYYFYLITYVVFYMIDDFIIFLIALATLRITKMSDKYLRFIMLISGIVLLLLGITMILKVL